ncbi:hypothetical protein H5410_053531 [Solanum commersonii]|uniref:Sulfate transporter n=1 Tax=Solanum commersonii TaxID=4109 RepID=A0A9J5X7F3_SOLCO|nr:hypothetical protein H5410_053531 [Solanum commersonii]
MESSTLEENNPHSQASKPNFMLKLKENLIFKSKWAELNGAMGDLGTYIPIVLALTLASHLNLGTTLIFTGVYNFVTGAIYGVPMPVQPMKSIAAVAISNPEFGIPEVMAAGICTAGILFVLGVTGLMRIVYRLIPISVVRGIQLAQGLSFAMTAVKYIKNVQDFAKSKSGAQRDWVGLDGLLLALICAVFIVIVNGAGDDDDDDRVDNQESETGWKKVQKIIFSLPSAFLIFLLGVVLAIIRGPNAIKVCKLSTDLFPEREVTATSVSMTVGLMNLIGCWFGAMPCCHGAGGLAGQYKFGGRSGGCVALLGVAKLVLGLVLGSSMVKVLTQFPVGVLGVLLLFAGIELAMCARDMNTKEEAFVVLVCTSVSLVGSSAALGFLCGIVVHLLLKMRNMGSDGQSCSDVLWFHRNP